MRGCAARGRPFQPISVASSRCAQLPPSAGVAQPDRAHYSANRGGTRRGARSGLPTQYWAWNRRRARSKQQLSPALA